MNASFLALLQASEKKVHQAILREREHPCPQHRDMVRAAEKRHVRLMRVLTESEKVS